MRSIFVPRLIRGLGLCADVKPQCVICFAPVRNYIARIPAFYLSEIVKQSVALGGGFYRAVNGQCRTYRVRAVGRERAMRFFAVSDRAKVDFCAADGVMHACGHDGHTANLLNVARIVGAKSNISSASLCSLRRVSVKYGNDILSIFSLYTKREHSLYSLR